MKEKFTSGQRKTLLLCFLCYSAAYTGRLNLSAALPGLRDGMGGVRRGRLAGRLRDVDSRVRRRRGVRHRGDTRREAHEKSDKRIIKQAGVHKNSQWSVSIQIRSISHATYYAAECSPLALPLGELSPQVTERVLQPFSMPSPSSLCSAASPRERQGVLA